MTEYAGIYLKKLKVCAENARILDGSDAIYDIRSLYKLLNSYQDRDVFRTLLNILDLIFSP